MGVGDQSLKDMNADQLMNKLGERLKQALVIIISALLDVGKAFAMGVLVVQKAFDYIRDVLKLAGLQLIETIGEIVKRLGNVVMTLGSMLGNEDMKNAGAGIFASGQGIKNVADKLGMDDLRKRIAEGVLNFTPAEMQVFNDAADKTKNDILNSLVDFLFPKPEEVEEGIGSDADLKPKQFTKDQVEAWMEFQEDLKAIDEKANEQRLEENERYQEQKTEIERRGNEARLERDKDIAAAQADKAKADLESAKERDENINKLKTDAGKEDRRRTEDHERQLAEIKSKSNRDMLKAAMNLDAQGVLDALTSRRERVAKENEEFAIEKQRRIEDMNERIALEEEGHKQRLQKAIEAEAKQVAQIEERYAKEAAALNRAMTKLDAEHTKRLTDIDNQAIRERNARERAFMIEFNQLEQHENRKLVIQGRGMAAAEAQLGAWWSRVAARMGTLPVPTMSNYGPVSSSFMTMPSGETGSVTVNNQGRRRIEFQTGTNRVPYTGTFGLHEGESVMRPDVAALARSMLGSNFTQEQLANRIAGGGSASINVGDVTLSPVFGDIGSYSREEIIQLAKEGFFEVLKEAAAAKGAKL